MSNPHRFADAELAGVYRAIAERRDMRHFLPDAIAPAVLERLLNAAHQAGSVGLMQPWRFIRITDSALRRQLHVLVEQERQATAEALAERHDDFMRLKVEGILECGELLVVALPDQRERHVFGRRTLPEMDLASAACAIQNLWLAARAEGLGMGWVSLFDPDALAELLAMPPGSKPIAILCLGHVTEFYPKPMLELEHWATPQALSALVFENGWRKHPDSRPAQSRQSGHASTEPVLSVAEELGMCASTEHSTNGCRDGVIVPQALMVQGTTSDAGKSTLVTALCRYYRRQGFNVAPFKPQNMALNSAVTVDGGEIGRAQAVQAAACGLPPHSDMNPVLLKPTADMSAQVIIHGRVLENQSARQYHDYKKVAKQAVLESWRRLGGQYQTVIVEGAGSPAEINLRDGDIANMGFAEAVDCPVLLIADIDRGGVFAHIVGTLALLSASEQRRIIGFVINRFRGDISLLQPGLDWLEAETGKPVLAVLPYLRDLHLEAEDALTFRQSATAAAKPFKVVVPCLPSFSNHTDFDPLQLHPGIAVQFATGPDQVDGADLIVLPGSKSVRSDLQRLRDLGWESVIHRHLRYGGKLLGICGGFQMLGQMIHDPYGLEGEPGSLPGLALLEMATTLQPEKCLRQVSGTFADRATPVAGYEIHMGVSSGPALSQPLFMLDGAADGTLSADGLIAGSYLHGLFDLPQACNALLGWAGYQAEQAVDFNAVREAAIERIADNWQEACDFEKLQQALQRFYRDGLKPRPE